MGAKSLVRKIMRTGYFWPTMQQDAAEFVRKCDSCQRYGNVQRVPGEQMTTISSPWPFAQWGIDIMGPLPQGKRQMKFLLVTIDYFTKWVEVEALAMITETKVHNFVWKNIVCRFGIPRTIISDNGRQFDNHLLQEGVFRRARQQRPTKAKPGSCGRSKRSSCAEDGQVQAKDS